MTNYARAWRKAVTAQLPSLLPLPAGDMDPLRIDRVTIDRLIAAGVPFHMAGDHKQDERPRAAEAAKRLAAGETLYLVQPHEFMPRLRRFVYLLSKAAGFLGRPARTFLFRVDEPGREAMPMHDDGPSDLAWIQLSGERYVTFGTPEAKGRKRALASANGATAGWFRGGQPPGTLLYLPPWAPHYVRCRKPSIAVSVYWEQVSAEEAFVDIASAVLEARPRRSFPTEKQLEQVGKSLAAAKQARREWLALQRTADGGNDAPPAALHDWEDPATPISAWRALETWEEGGEAKLVAGGEAVLTFPRKVLPVLEALRAYGAATRGALARKSGLQAKELTRLLDVLFAEGLVTAGELPLVGEFDAASLTGWEYEV